MMFHFASDGWFPILDLLIPVDSFVAGWNLKTRWPNNATKLNVQKNIRCPRFPSASRFRYIRNLRAITHRLRVKGLWFCQCREYLPLCRWSYVHNRLRYQLLHKPSWHDTHWFPFFVWCISVSRLPILFFMELKSAIIVTSTIDPPCMINSTFSRRSATYWKILSPMWFCSRRCRNFKSVAVSGFWSS